MSWEVILGLIFFIPGVIGILIDEINWDFVKSKIKRRKK